MFKLWLVTNYCSFDNFGVLVLEVEYSAMSIASHINIELTVLDMTLDMK